MASEWLAANFPASEIRTRVRLGKVPPEIVSALPPSLSPRALQFLQRWADAVIIERNRVIIAEFKIRTAATAIGQLLLYRQLLPETPELAEHAPKPIKLLLVTAQADPEVVAFGRGQGIRVEIYRPQWIINYLRDLRVLRE